MTNTTWSLRQIDQAGLLRVQIDVDQEVLVRAPGEAEAAIKKRMADRLINDAHPFGVELHPDDLEFIQLESPERPWTVTYRARWKPGTNVAELRGGPQDGARLALQRVGEAIRLPVLTSSPWTEAQSPTAEVAIMDIRYELIGWDETERCWVYAPA